MSAIDRRIKEFRASLGLTQDDFAKALDVKPSKIRDIEAGRQRVNDDFVAQLSSRYPVDLNWLFSNPVQSVSEIETEIYKKSMRDISGKTLIDDLNAEQNRTEQELAAQALKVTKEYWRQKQPNPIDYQMVPLHDAELAAGSGSQNDHDLVMDSFAFRRDWLRRIGVSPDSARLARARGDSMAPTLLDRDLLLIDTSRSEIPIRPRKSGQPLRANLYALIEDGLARVKRIERSSADTLALHSDNVTLYPPEIRAGAEIGQLNIIGKVVWWGHTVRD